MTRSVVLGVHDGHDASAALVVDGVLVAAAQEERYSRLKNQAGHPTRAIAAVLEVAGLAGGDVDTVAVAGRTVWAGVAPADSHTRASAVAHHQALLDGARIDGARAALRERAPGLVRVRRRGQLQARRDAYAALHPGADVVLVEHHECHAAGAYHGWGVDGPVLVLTADGEGDDLAGSVSIGDGGRLERKAVIHQSESLGWIYEAATFLLGMQPGEHEYKLMGLAPYAAGAPQVAELRERLRRCFVVGDDRTGLGWRRAPGVPPLHRSTPFLAELFGRARFDHVAAAVQAVTEDVVVDWVRRCVARTGIRRVACSGGVFMNVKANGLLLDLDEVDELFVMPTPTDTSNAIGAAWTTIARAAAPVSIAPLEDLYLGDALTDDAVRRALAGTDWIVEWPDDPEAVVAGLLADGEIVGRAVGRMEFGARALGNRSLLADPARPGVVQQLNAAIKSRDFWMPFAPVLREESGPSHLVATHARTRSDRYMMVAVGSAGPTRDTFPAAQHPADHTARPQLVPESWNPALHALLGHFEACTGRSVLLNTSLNVHGEPIVRTPEEALDLLARTGLRHLQLGGAIVTDPRACVST